MDRASLIRKAEALRALHVPGRPLVLLNAWDEGSAKLVAAEGFPAIATTSAGIAFKLGKPDGEVIGRDAMLANVAAIAAAVSVPVTADMEAGYGRAPEAVADTVTRTLAAGAVGANIEDSAPTAAHGHALLPFDLAVARIKAGVAAATAAGVPFVLNARTDAFFGAKDLEAAFAEAVRRANAYLAAGAASAFVPFTADSATIGRLAKAISGPLNVICGGALSVPALAALGVARVSFGGALTRAAYGLVRAAAREVQAAGTHGWSAGAMTQGELNTLFGKKL
jgi:2-methylisocitrate lyase-like PEP mutase family enzyme